MATDFKTYLRAAGIGVIAGMRSLSAPALVSGYLVDRGRGRLRGTPFSVLESERAAAVLKTLAAAEAMADKLPFVPARIGPAPLLARAASGAVSGAALARAAGERAGLGAVAGALGALAGAYGFYHLRRRVGRSRAIPDAWLGLAEDALVVGGGRRLLRDLDAE